MVRQDKRQDSTMVANTKINVEKLRELVPLKSGTG